MFQFCYSPSIDMMQLLDHGPVGEILPPPWGFLKTSIFIKYVTLALQKRLSDQKLLVEYAKEANSKW